MYLFIFMFIYGYVQRMMALWTQFSAESLENLRQKTVHMNFRNCRASAFQKRPVFPYVHIKNSCFLYLKRSVLQKRWILPKHRLEDGFLLRRFCGMPSIIFVKIQF